MISAIANKGYYYKPKIIANEENDCKNVAVDKKYFDIIRNGMLKVVDERGGTGHRAFVKGIDIAGKTGTVELTSEKKYTWFAGFAPFDDPEIVVVVVTEGGDSGGTTAAPIAGAVFEEWKKYR